MKISSLSKTELLALIYHYLPHTRYDDHEVACTVCAKDWAGKPDDAFVIICDKCEEALADEVYE